MRLADRNVPFLWCFQGSTENTPWSSNRDVARGSDLDVFMNWNPETPGESFEFEMHYIFSTISVNVRSYIRTQSCIRYGWIHVDGPTHICECWAYSTRAHKRQWYVFKLTLEPDPIQGRDEGGCVPDCQRCRVRLRRQRLMLPTGPNATMVESCKREVFGVAGTGKAQH